MLPVRTHSPKGKDTKEKEKGTREKKRSNRKESGKDKEEELDLDSLDIIRVSYSDSSSETTFDAEATLEGILYVKTVIHSRKGENPAKRGK
jgi:hypothetical protein